MNPKENDISVDPSEETIVAIATPPGQGGIGIVRLSGPAAETIGRRLFSFVREPAKIEPYRLYPGAVTLPDARTEGTAAPRSRPSINDRALFVLMRAPRSYTGQDVVELQCHGSPLLLASAVAAAVSLGARPAKRGEFTRRAFMGGKIDLVQAEAVADLIAAKTADGLSIFSRHLMGGLSERLLELRTGLVSLLADIEAAVDFSDQDIAPPDMGAIAGGIEESARAVAGLVSSYRAGRVYREGARLVIAGRPNVGKSSLMNRLLGRERAIVAPEPGTTTDFIEDVMDIAGVPVRIVDTCGLREAGGTIEREGVRRTKQALSAADVTLLVAEATAEIGPEERGVIEAAAAADRRAVLVMNKIDLVGGDPREPADIGVPIVFTSALTGSGIEELKALIGSLIVGGAGRAGGEELIANERHYAALLLASESLARAYAGAQGGVSPEFIALDIREALSALGEMTGDVTSDEILEAIFSRFCIGK